MFTLCWSPKGGSGTTVTVTALALLSAREQPTVVIDLGGDVPAALGVAEGGGAGVADWLAAPHARAEELLRLATRAVDDLAIVPPGRIESIDDDGWQRLADAARSATGSTPLSVFIDAGPFVPPLLVHSVAGASLLIIRPCYLGLRRAVRHQGCATAVVMVGEPGRALGATDIERALGVPVVAEIVWDPAIARAVDAGLLGSRLPGGLVRELRRVGRTDHAA